MYYVFDPNENKNITEKVNTEEQGTQVERFDTENINIEPIRKYIHNQETHHSKNSFLKEVDDFMEKYDWE